MCDFVCPGVSVERRQVVRLVLQTKGQTWMVDDVGNVEVMSDIETSETWQREREREKEGEREQTVSANE